MNQSPQPGVHPDAESLTAFAERALPAAERGSVMAHLAECARCREVVFLAQAAAAAEVRPEVAVSEPVASGGAGAIRTEVRAEIRAGVRAVRRGVWWLGRGWALVGPAAALAAGALLVFWIEKPVPEAPVEVTGSTAPGGEVPGPGWKAAAPAPQAPARRRPMAGAKEGQAGGGERRAPAAQQEPGLRAQTALNELEDKRAEGAPGVPDRGQGLEALQFSAEAKAAQGGPERMHGTIALPPVPVPAGARPPGAPGPPPAPTGLSATAWQQPGQSPAQNALASVTASARTETEAIQGIGLKPGETRSAGATSATWGQAGSPAAGPAALGAAQFAPAKPEAVESARLGAPSQQALMAVAGNPASQQALMAVAGNPASQLARVDKPAAYVLPSGLMSVATTRLGERMLALDPGGAMFVSGDGGRKWEAVEVPWPGKVIRVGTSPPRPFGAGVIGALENAATDEKESLPPGAAGEEKAGPKPGAPVAPPMFRIVTDRGEIWMSADGKSWRNAGEKVKK